MFINSNIQAVAGAYNVNRSALPRHAQKDEGAKATDEVHLSTGAQSFSGLLQQLHGMEEVRADKVEVLSKQVADDSYSVAAENVASSLINKRF